MKKNFVSRGFLPQNMGCVADHCASDASRRLSFYYFGNNICQSRHSRESGNHELDWMPDQSLPRTRSGVRHDIRYLMAREMIDPERCGQRRAVACPLHTVVRSFLVLSLKVVTPVKTGVQCFCNPLKSLDSGFHRNDDSWAFLTFDEFGHSSVIMPYGNLAFVNSR